MYECDYCPLGYANVGVANTGNSSCVKGDCQALYYNSQTGEAYFADYSYSYGEFAAVSLTCSNNGPFGAGNLIIPSNQDELNFAEDVYSSNYWVGLHQIDTSNEPDGGWQWLNGTNMTQPNSLWYFANPENAGDCAAERDGLLIDYDCMASNLGVCEYKVTNPSNNIQICVQN
jgi:hypothetical protein